MEEDIGSDGDDDLDDDDDEEKKYGMIDKYSIGKNKQIKKRYCFNVLLVHITVLISLYSGTRDHDSGSTKLYQSMVITECLWNYDMKKG